MTITDPLEALRAVDDAVTTAGESASEAAQAAEAARDEALADLQAKAEDLKSDHA